MARLAISDIHGCLQTWKLLLFNKIGLKKSDELYLLGDYINKGPDSKGVLDFITELISNGFLIYPIRGNHDQMLLDVQQQSDCADWYSETQKINSLYSFGVQSPHDVPKNYLTQIAAMPYYIELDKFFLVHAGFNFGLPDPFSDPQSMMEIKQFDYQAYPVKGKTIIHGHVPQHLHKIQECIYQQQRILKIDAGCVYNTSEGYGNLLGLDLDNFTMYVQANSEKPYEIAKKEI